MRAQTFVLDQLMDLNLDNLLYGLSYSILTFEPYRERKKGKALKATIEQLDNSVSTINRLHTDFIKEIRHNAYNSDLNEKIKNAYAVDCCNLIDNWKRAGERFHNIELASQIPRITTAQMSLIAKVEFIGQDFYISPIYDAIEEYFPNTKTIARERDSTDNGYAHTILAPEKMKTEDQQDTKPALPGQGPTELYKSSRKRSQAGWKEQLIMMDELGLLDAGKLERLNNMQKAKVLAVLLNRTEQDVRVLLGNWKGRKNPAQLDAKYLIKEHHEESVKDLLLDLGVPF